MAFVHPIFASVNHPIFSPNKCSVFLGVKLIPEHAYSRCHSKKHFTIALNQNIHISKNGKGRVRVAFSLFVLYNRVSETIFS